MTSLGVVAVARRSLPVAAVILLVVSEAAFAAASGGNNDDVAPVSYAVRSSGAERRAQSIASFDRRDELEDIVAKAAKKRGSRRVVSGPEGGGGGRYWKGLSGRTSWTGFYTDDFDREGIVVPERKKKAAAEEAAESIDEKKRRAKLKEKKKTKAVREKAGRRGHRAPSASSRRPRRRRRAGTKKNDDVDDDVPPPLERARYFFPSDLKPDVEGSRSMWFEYPQRGREMVRTVPRSVGFYSNDLVDAETWIN